MKIFSWMRSSKRNGNDATTNNHNPQPNSHGNIVHEEFSDWPNSLLAIGTFGNNHNLKHSEKLLGDLEQQVERELIRPVTNEEQLSLDSDFSAEKENLSVDQLLDCLRHDGDDDDSGGGGTRLERQSSVVQRGSKEIQSDKRNRGISKTSLTFLIKKALLCGGGFATAPPIPRDPLLDPKSDQSTMGKILRAMLHKKIYPQRPTPKKYLDIGERESEERECEKGSKWVKTDSEFIVLEI